MKYTEFRKVKSQMTLQNCTQEKLAKEIGVSSSTLNLKLKGKRDLYAHEIKKICEVLAIPRDKITEYFFE